jgi:hypothetical protein
MAVLVEGISVVLKAQTIADHFPGGAEAFGKATPPRAPMCSDGELVCMHFWSPLDVQPFVESLAGAGT